MATQAQRQLLALGVAAAILALVGGFAWFGVHLADEERARLDAAGARLFPAPEERLAEVDVRVGEQTTILGREGQRFTIVGPRRLPPDPVAIEALVFTLGHAARRRAISPPDGGAAALGLDPPKARIEARYDDGSRHVIELGELNSFDDSVFARVEGRPELFTIARDDARALARRPFELRERRPLPFAPEEATRLEVDLLGRRFTLERDSADEWRILEPAPDRAAPAVVARLLAGLSRFESSAVLAELDDPQLFPAGEQRGLLRVELVDGTDRELFVVKDRELLLARDPDEPSLYSLDEQRLLALLPSPEGLVDRALLASTGVEVRGLSFERVGEAPLEVARASADAPWFVATPPKGPALQHRVAFALTTLLTLEFEEWRTLVPENAAELGLAPAERRITLTGEGGVMLERILVGTPRADGSVWISVAGSGKAGRVAARRVAELPNRPAELRAP